VLFSEKAISSNVQMKNLKKSIFGQYQYNFYYHIPLELQAVPVLFPPLELQAVSQKINEKN
jgi:hypothetical protein